VWSKEETKEKKEDNVEKQNKRRKPVKIEIDI
jgi:hypothetical protein